MPGTGNSDIKPRRGAPSKFTEEVRLAIIGRIKGGSSPTVACQAAGINPRTLYRWRQKARGEEGTELAEFINELELAWSESRAFGEEAIYKAGAPKARRPSCEACKISYKEIECPSCGEDVELKCTECNRELKVRTSGDWRAMAHWMKCQFRNKWGDKVDINVESQWQASLMALSQEFDGEPEVFDRILDVLTRGDGPVAMLEVE